MATKKIEMLNPFQMLGRKAIPRDVPRKVNSSAMRTAIVLSRKLLLKKKHSEEESANIMVDGEKRSMLCPVDTETGKHLILRTWVNVTTGKSWSRTMQENGSYTTKDGDERPTFKYNDTLFFFGTPKSGDNEGVETLYSKFSPLQSNQDNQSQSDKALENVDAPV